MEIERNLKNIAQGKIQQKLVKNCKKLMNNLINKFKKYENYVLDIIIFNQVYDNALEQMKIIYNYFVQFK